MSTTSQDQVSPAVFMSLLAAFLPTKGRYSIEVGKWTNAVKILRDRHEEEHPELFRGFSIYERPPAPPWSPEIESWLIHLYHVIDAPGGPIRTEAGSLIWLEFPSSFQATLKRQNIPHPRLEDKVIRVLQKFAKEVAQEKLLAP